MSVCGPLALNCDVGEAETLEEMMCEAQILPFVTSINVACGGHAGSPESMRRIVEAALPYNLALGAHPGFPDRASRGRREQDWSESWIRDVIHKQVGALRTICREQGARLTHVKPHGALYNMAARDRGLADAVASAIRDFDPSLIVVALAGSALVVAGRALGLKMASEGFADRAYRSNGQLLPRNQPGALLTDELLVVAQALSLARDGVVTAIDGVRLAIRVETLCLHGDTPASLRLTRAIQEALITAGVSLKRIDDVV